MNRFLTIACCFATLGSQAQDLVIKTKSAADTKIPIANIEYMQAAEQLQVKTRSAATPVVFNIADIEYITVDLNAHADMKELVEMEVVNMGRFSFDVSVKKSPECEKYIVGAVASNVYNESNFVDAAIQTLDENAFYRPYEHSIGTTDNIFPERDLGINLITNYDSDSRSTVYTTVAICAFAKDGSHKIYTHEFIVPDVTRASSPTVTLASGNVTPEDFDVTITASPDCKKIIYGVTSPEALSGKKMSADLMLSVSQSLPVPYTAPLNLSVSSMQTISPNSTYYVYAIPIALDGTVGEVSFITVNTPAITADGMGKVLSASGTLQVEGQYKTVSVPQMTFNADARKVRILWCSDTDFESYKGRLTEVFGKSNYKNMAWSEYDIDNLPRTLSVYHYGDKHYMYAATVDKNGQVSPAQDILEMMGVASPYVTNAKSDYVPDINFDGKAKATIVNDDTELVYSPYVEGRVIETNPWFTIQPGENLASVIVLRIDGDEVNIEKAVESVLIGYPGFAVGMDGAKCELQYKGGTWSVSPADALDNCTINGSKLRFKERWLTYEKLVFVTVDNAGRPRIACSYNPDTRTLTQY